jgi:uncharacterized protein
MGAGKFVWYEMMSKDPKASEEFYSKFVGWSFKDVPMGDFTYRLIHAGEPMVGGIMPLEEKQDIPSHWITYITVDDVDETVKKAVELGGTSCVPPTDIPEVGRFAVVTDPQGAVFSPFKSKSDEEHPNPTGPGTFAWQELITSDPKGAKDFYTKLLGWGAEESEIDPDNPYLMFKAGDKEVGGMMMKPIPEGGGRPYWIPYLTVDDVDAATKTAEENGGKTHVSPTDIPNIGRFSIMQDSQGAAFGLWAPPK